MNCGKTNRVGYVPLRKRKGVAIDPPSARAFIAVRDLHEKKGKAFERWTPGNVGEMLDRDPVAPDHAVHDGGGEEGGLADQPRSSCINLEGGDIGLALDRIHCTTGDGVEADEVTLLEEVEHHSLSIRHRLVGKRPAGRDELELPCRFAFINQSRSGWIEAAYDRDAWTADLRFGRRMLKGHAPQKLYESL